MRKIAFICIVAGGLVSGWNVALGASHYSVGVPLNPSKCVITPDSDMYSIDWKGPCTSSVNGANVVVLVAGIGMCAVETGEIGDVADVINTSDSGGNKTCWCRMISPWVSKWVVAYSTTYAQDNCYENCAQSCASAMNSNSTFRGTITDVLFNAVSL